MAPKLPAEGFLSLPLRLEKGRLESCDLRESIRRFMQLNLNVPEQGKARPAWLSADPEVGCRVPHHDFQAVTQALGSDTSRLMQAVKHAATIDPRVDHVDIHIVEVGRGDASRRREDGSFFKGLIKRVTILVRRTDGGEQKLEYDVAFGGSGPVFGEDD